ncbi:MAG: glycosyltransferase, partial [Frankiaceae bacterium]|nr:glycosyltransferase [Frankiaceae bacterium]
GATVATRRTLRGLLDRVDIVHAHGGRAGALAATAGVRPLVVTLHNAPAGPRRHRLMLWLLERIATRGAALTIGASPDLAQRAMAAGAREVRFVPVSVPPLPAARRSLTEMRADLGLIDRPVVLVVARLARQKRLDVLVEASRGWANDASAPVVLVAGDGRCRTDIEAAALAAASSVRLLGHRFDIPDLLAAADLVAVTSDWEARPLVAQEALRVGVPLVATDVGGVAELVGPAAVLVPAGDAAGLRAAILRVAGDEAERRRLADLGYEQAASWPSVESMVDELEMCYLDLCST